MTAESQLLTGKMLRVFLKRGFQPLALGEWTGGLPINRLDKEFAKRLFDILFSPVYLLLSLLIAISSPGPIFYIQERVGKDHKRFGCIKFRSMVENAAET